MWRLTYGRKWCGHGAAGGGGVSSVPDSGAGGGREGEAAGVGACAAAAVSPPRRSRICEHRQILSQAPKLKARDEAAVSHQKFSSQSQNCNFYK